jgi:hypothetical protein
MGGGARLAMGNPHGDGAPTRRWGGSPATWKGLGGSRDARGLLQDSQAKKEGGGRVFANCQHLSF